MGRAGSRAYIYMPDVAVKVHMTQLAEIVGSSIAVGFKAASLASTPSAEI